MQKSSPPKFEPHTLERSKLSNTIPLAIRSTKHFKQLNNIELKTSAGHTKRLSTNGTIPTIIKNTSSHYSRNDNFEILIDETFITENKELTLHNCNNFRIKTAPTPLRLRSNAKFLITLINCHSFSLEGLETIGGRNIITISNSFNFTLSNCKSQKADGYGIIVHNSTKFSIKDCAVQNNRSGIMLVGSSAHAIIKNCNCQNLYGFFNCDAGIHLCATSSAITLAEIPWQCHEALSIEKKPLHPQHIVIENCTLSGCRAQGLYLEGAVNCLIHGNNFTKNNKEGVCFDWGSCYNIFINNTVSLNGERRKLTQEEIKADFIVEYPMLNDGSSSMKLPGISLDNGSLNLIDTNKITSNFGGGIKMVRSAISNTISKNHITDNAIGKNNFVPFFHGISALGVGAVNNEFLQDKDTLLDFFPSILNTISENIITGHYQSIYCDKVSESNYLLKNRCSHTCGFKERCLTIPRKIISRLKRITANQVTALLPSQDFEEFRQDLNAPRLEIQNIFHRLSKQLLCKILKNISGKSWKHLRFYPHSVPTDALLKHWQESEWDIYQKWIDKHSICSQKQWLELHKQAINGRDFPRISIVTPVFNTDAETLHICIASVQLQTSPFWELILVDDGSTHHETLQVLQSKICKDPRIKIFHPNGKESTGISAATNRGIEEASGDYIIFLDHDDRLALEAVQNVSRALQKNPTLDIIYSDRDMISPENKRFMYLMKPGWSPENLYSGNYIFHKMCYRKRLLTEVGNLRSEYDGSQDYDLILRCMELTQKVHHIPQVLYHWRQHEQSVARSDDAKSYAFEAGIRALEDTLRRRRIKGEVTEDNTLPRGIYHVHLPPLDKSQIGVISIAKEMASEQYQNTIMSSIVIREGTQPYILIQHQDYKEQNPETMETMAAWLQLESIGMVSGCLLNNAGHFINAGTTYDEKGELLFPYFSYPFKEQGYMAVTKTVRNISAPDPFSVIIRRELWEMLGGFDTKYKGPHALLDFALRALQADWRLIYHPQSVYQCNTSLIETGLVKNDKIIFMTQWDNFFQKGDPYYSSIFSRQGNLYELKL